MPETPSAAERLEALENEVRQGTGRWLVLCHDNPDPDALASAAILGNILARVFKQKVTLAYGGIIGRAENRELARSMGVKFSHLRNLNLKHYRRFALVDAQPHTGNSQMPEGVLPDLVFDHHPKRRTTQSVAYSDVRVDLGATTTMLAGYLDTAELPVPRWLATAIVYAIRSETQEFGREYTAADKAVYDRYLPLVDRRLLAKIQNARLTVGYFQNLHDALENMYAVSTLVMSHLDRVDQPDIVPEIADLLLRMEGKTWSLVSGLFEDRIHLSIRTTNPRADAGALIRRLIGQRGKGGGHGMLAGGWVSIENVKNGDAKNFQQYLGRRLAKMLRKNPDKIEPLAFRENGRSGESDDA